MIGSSENGNYFDGAANNDEWLRRELQLVRDEALDSSVYPDLESQQLREIAQDAAQISFEELNYPNIRAIIIQTVSREFRYQLIGLVESGLLVRNLDEGETLIIRGTAYCMSLDTFTDRYSYSLFDNHFLGKNYPASTVEHPSSSIPFIALKGQIGQYGYLIVSDAYTRKQIEDALVARGIDPSEVTLPPRTNNTSSLGYLAMRETEIIQHPVLDIDFEYQRTG